MNNEEKSELESLITQNDLKRYLDQIRNEKLKEFNVADGGALCREINLGFAYKMYDLGLDGFVVISNNFPLLKITPDSKTASHVMSVFKLKEGFFLCDGTGDQVDLEDSTPVDIRFCGATEPEVFTFLQKRFHCDWQTFMTRKEYDEPLPQRGSRMTA